MLMSRGRPITVPLCASTKNSSVGPAPRNAEKALWERFHAACDAFFTRLVQSIQDAQSEVTIRLFIFDNDDYAVRLADLLKRRSREVRVRVLVDALGTLGAGEAAPPGAASKPAFDMARYLRADSRIEVRETPNA